MTMIDSFFPPVPAYDPGKDPLARPSAEEVAEAPIHSNVCAIRYSTLAAGVHDLRVEMRGFKIFFIKIIALAVTLSVAGVVGGLKAVELVSKVM